MAAVKVGWPVDNTADRGPRGLRRSAPVEAEGIEPGRIRPGMAVIITPPVAGVSAGISIPGRGVAGPVGTIRTVGLGTCQC